MFSKNKNEMCHDEGFSIIELLVTSAIITIVTAIVIVKHSSFNNSVLIRNQAYEMALIIREAQVFAVSSRGSGTGFRERYGVYINVDSATNRSNMIVYLDKDSSYGYSEDDDAVFEKNVLDSRFEINDVCVDVDSSVDEVCVSDGSEVFSVSFQRPDFDPFFTLHDGTNYGDEVLAARIKITPTGETEPFRTIEITSSGQVSVQ